MGAGGHAPETAAGILEGSRVTTRVPASDNKRVAAYARFARSGEHGAGAPRRQLLNVIGHAQGDVVPRDRSVGESGSVS